MSPMAVDGPPFVAALPVTSGTGLAQVLIKVEVMNSSAITGRRFTTLIATCVTLVLLLGSGDLHASISGGAILITSTPVLATSPCGLECAHYDRSEGELSRDHPVARLSQHISLVLEAPVSIPVIVATTLPLRAQPAAIDLRLGPPLPPRAPPAV